MCVCGGGKETYTCLREMAKCSSCLFFFPPTLFCELSSSTSALSSSSFSSCPYSLVQFSSVFLPPAHSSFPPTIYPFPFLFLLLFYLPPSSPLLHTSTLHLSLANNRRLPLYRIHCLLHPFPFLPPATFSTSSSLLRLSVSSSHFISCICVYNGHPFTSFLIFSVFAFL